MIIGAGIGVTPLASTFKSIIHNKWKNYVGNCFPNNAYFYWVVAHDEVQSFRWFLREIKDGIDALIDMRQKDPNGMVAKDFEFHIFVTSVKEPIIVNIDDTPGSDDIAFWGPSRKKSSVFAKAVDMVQAQWSEADLLAALLNPDATPKLGDEVFIYSGRPAWEDQFKHIESKYQTGKIGVTFCGNPKIGADLGHLCAKHSSVSDLRFFTFHKEKF